jgi:hypothetical protein
VGPRAASTQQAREFVFETREHTQRPGIVKTRIDSHGTLKRAPRAPRQLDSRQRIGRLRLKRQIHSEPEVALDAIGCAPRGPLAKDSAARVKLSGRRVFLWLLGQKKYRAAPAPHGLEIIIYRRCCAFQQLDRGANIFYPLALTVERVGPPDYFGEALLHKKSCARCL